MLQPPQNFTLFPYTTLFRSLFDQASKALDVGAGNRFATEHELEAVELRRIVRAGQDRKSTRLNSSHGYISYAVFCLKKKKAIDIAHYSHVLCLVLFFLGVAH